MTHLASSACTRQRLTKQRRDCDFSPVLVPLLQPQGREGFGYPQAACAGGLRGALGGAVVVRAPVRVLSLALGDGLHGRVVQPAAHAVAAAAGRGRGPRTPNPRRRRGGEVLGGKPFRVDSWGARRERGQGLGPRGPVMGILPALRGLYRQLPRGFGQDGTLEDLGGRHAVAGVGATAFLEEQQLKLFIGGVGLLGVAIDEPRRPLAVGGCHVAAS